MASADAPRPALVVTEPRTDRGRTADALLRFSRLRAIGLSIDASVELADNGYDVVGFALLDGAA